MKGVHCALCYKLHKQNNTVKPTEKNDNSQDARTISAVAKHHNKKKFRLFTEQQKIFFGESVYAEKQEKISKRKNIRPTSSK